MAKLTTPTDTIKTTLEATIGQVAPIKLAESKAAKFNVRIYAAGWGALIAWANGLPIGDALDLNRFDLEPGQYEVEFRPHDAGGGYIGKDRQFFRLVLAPAGAKPNPMLLGIVDATKAFRPETPCFSSHWNGPKQWLDVCRLTNVRWIREWWTLNEKMANWSKWDRVRPFVRAGMRLTVCLHWGGKPLPSPAVTSAAVRSVIRYVPPDLAPMIDWEVENEPGLGNYWDGNNITEYVRRFLNPAYDLLHDAGYTVISGGLNADFPKQFEEMQAAGAKFDEIGIHPYATSLADFRAKYSRLRALTGRPVRETESRAFWGSRYKSADPKTRVTAAEWIAEDNRQLAARAEFGPITGYCVFGPDVRDSATGPGGLFAVENVNGLPVKAAATPFFNDWFFGLHKQFAK